ncbi:MAG: hypothetical protein U0840_29560 [Gemmataceae bacterium]
MPPLFFRSLLLLVLVTALCSLPACQSGVSKVKVTGKLTKGGKPLEVKAMVGKVVLMLEPVDAKGGEEYAVLQADGSFTVPGPDKRGIPPGKYRLVIQQFDEFGRTPDKLGGAYERGKSPLIRDITPQSAFLEIDLDKVSK